MAEVYLEFKYRKNQLLSFPDGNHYAIPMELKPATNPEAQGILNRQKQPPMQPVFGMDKIHKFPLQDEAIPADISEMPEDDSYAKELKSEAYRFSLEARKSNDAVRKFFYFYSSDKAGKVLEIVKDPYATRRVEYGNALKKPSEILHENSKKTHKVV
jgi:hypothetical protein